MTSRHLSHRILCNDHIAARDHIAAHSSIRHRLFILSHLISICFLQKVFVIHLFLPSPRLDSKSKVKNICNNNVKLELAFPIHEVGIPAPNYYSSVSTYSSTVWISRLWFARHKHTCTSNRRRKSYLMFKIIIGLLVAIIKSNYSWSLDNSYNQTY